MTMFYSKEELKLLADKRAREWAASEETIAKEALRLYREWTAVPNAGLPEWAGLPK